MSSSSTKVDKKNNKTDSSSSSEGRVTKIHEKEDSLKSSTSSNKTPIQPALELIKSGEKMRKQKEKQSESMTVVPSSSSTQEQHRRQDIARSPTTRRKLRRLWGGRVWWLRRQHWRCSVGRIGIHGRAEAGSLTRASLFPRKHGHVRLRRRRLRW